MTDPSLYGATPHAIAVRAGLPLSVAQSALLKAMAGEALDAEDLRAFRAMTGTWFGRPRSSGYRECWFTAGRRSGKTSRILACFAVSVALDPKYEVNGAPGERFGVFIAAPILEKTNQLMNTIRGLLDRLGVAYTQRDGWIVLSDRPVDIRPMPMTAVHTAADSAKAVIIDDLAKAQTTEGGARYDAAFIAGARAMTLSTGGPLVSGSQAWAREGTHFETCEKHWKDTEGDLLVARGKTWEWVPQHTREECMRLAGGDRRVFAREYEATPGHNEDQLFDGDDIDACVATGVRERRRRPGIVYSACADLGFRNDYSALVVGHREEKRLPDGSSRDLFVEDAIRVFKPKRGEPLDPEAVLAAIAAELKSRNVRELACDQHHFDSVRSRLRHFGIEAVLLRVDLQAQAKRATAFMEKLRARDLLLLDDPEANRELARLRMRLRSQGLFSYAAPERAGSHDDVSDARIALFGERLRHAQRSDAGDVLIDRDMPRCPITGDHDVPVRYLAVKNRDGIEVGRHFLPPARGTPRWDRWCRRELAKGVRSGEPWDFAIERTGMEIPTEDAIRALVTERYGGEMDEIPITFSPTRDDPMARAMRVAKRR